MHGEQRPWLPLILLINGVLRGVEREIQEQGWRAQAGRRVVQLGTQER